METITSKQIVYLFYSYDQEVSCILPDGLKQGHIVNWSKCPQILQYLKYMHIRYINYKTTNSECSKSKFFHSISYSVHMDIILSIVVVLHTVSPHKFS